MGVVQMMTWIGFWEEVLALFVAGLKEIPSGLCGVHLIFGFCVLDISNEEVMSQILSPKQSKDKPDRGCRAICSKPSQAQTETPQEGYLPTDTFLSTSAGCLSWYCMAWIGWCEILI